MASAFGHGGTPAPAGARRFGWLDKLIGVTTESVAAALVVVEIGVLLAGVIARYVLQKPLVWSDELASILFLWLAMFGAVIALRRGEHMRLTALVARVSPGWRAWLETLSSLLVGLFVLMILIPTHEYVEDEAFITTPALEIANSWRVLAIEVGMALMLLISVMRLIERSSFVQVIIAFAVVAAVAGGLWFAKPMLMAMGNYNLFVFFVALVAVMVAMGAPIAFAFAVATLGYLTICTTAPITVLVSRMDEGMSHIILLSVPLFVFLGLLIEMAGLARAMVDFLASLLGHVRGGLSYVLLGAMYLVSGISGSKAADMAAVAPVLFPEMKKRGSKPGELVALLAASGAMSETIPPSLVLITIGSVTGVSIAALFTGGLVPALVLAAALAILAYFRSKDDDLTGVKRAPWGTVLRLFVIASPAIALPFLIRAAVVEGVATATEVSTIGVAYTIIAGLVIYRQFDWKRLYPMLIDTASLSGAILLIIGAATGMAWSLTQSGFSRELAVTMAGIPGGATGFMFISILVFVVLGSVLEGIPAIVLFGPLLFPIAKLVGIHEVHYAMVVILAMGIGLFAPPFGVGFYAACAIGRVDPNEAMDRIWPYLGALLIALLLVAAIPWFSIGFL